jgi:teichuronic acid biosynthesis glycosyltransferase TuaC
MRVLILTNMYPTPDRPFWGTFVRDQVESLRAEGIEVDVFRVDGWKSKLNYIWGIFRLWAWLLTHPRYDLIHAHYVFSGLIARAQFRYPVILTNHGVEFWTWQFIACRLVNPFINKVILVSNEMDKRLNSKKAVVIPCGIDLDFFKPISREAAREKLKLTKDKKLVLWAGMHTRPEKRFDIVEKAIALVKEKETNVELVLVSGQPHNVVPLYMSACDVLLLVSDREGSPMVVKEAMSCNLPVVSVAVGDVPEVIGGTEGCYLCSQDPTDVAEKLLLSLKHPSRTNGRENIKHLDEKIIAKRIISLYEEVLGDKKGNA